MKTKVLFVLPKTAQGGAETQLLYLLRGIDKEKFEVTLGLLYKDEHLKSEYQNLKDVQVINFEKKGRLDVAIYLRIAKFIKDNKIDVVQTFLGNHHSYIPCILAGRGMPIGGVRNTFADKITLTEGIKEFFLPRLLASQKKFYLVSNSYTAMHTLKDFKKDTVLVIPNGIVYDQYKKGNGKLIRKELKLGNKLLLGMIARMVPGKNQEMLVRNYLKMTKGSKNVAMLMVGDGPEKEKLIQLSKDLGLEKDIIFTGNRRDIPNLLSAIDIFLFPSTLLEGWPNSIGEAMAAGLPVVAFNMGDVAKIIDDGIDGYVVDHDENLFCEHVRRLIKNKTLRNKIGQRATKKIKTEFPVSKMVKMYEELYEKVSKK